MLTKLKNGLDGTQLKTIALALMVLDHIHYFFEFTGCIPTVFSMLGRLSAPLFLFCTVEGFAHTHDRRRYFIRIWAIGTAMAALEFFMIYAKAFRRGDGFYPLNAIFQDLMLLCIVWQGIDWLREKKWVRGVAASLQAQWKMEQQQREQIIQLSHELKTPLAVIEGNADLLAEDEALTPEQREQVEAILRGTEQTRTYLLKIRAQVQTPLKYKRP